MLRRVGARAGSLAATDRVTVTGGDRVACGMRSNRLHCHQSAERRPLKAGPAGAGGAAGRGRRDHWGQLRAELVAGYADYLASYGILAAPQAWAAAVTTEFLPPR
jgi:hypothetical protein